MLAKTNYTVNQLLLQEAIDNLPSNQFRTAINLPSGNFFYDPWTIKSEFKNTIWDQILSTLPKPFGEARIVNLNPATNYQIHADLDDRYHLNITGEECYLIDITAGKMHLLVPDGIWYTMNAGKLHSAANFGRQHRIQLVVRQLLTNAELTDPVTVTICNNIFSENDARFMFDNTISPWLNKIQKQNKLANFTYTEKVVKFQTTQNIAEELKTITLNGFEIHYDRY